MSKNTRDLRQRRSLFTKTRIISTANLIRRNIYPMKVSELIGKLKQKQDEHGDLDIFFVTGVDELIPTCIQKVVAGPLPNSGNCGHVNLPDRLVIMGKDAHCKNPNE